MKILNIGKCYALYIAKLHEALRTGLSRTYDVRFFGEGYDGFDPSLKTYSEIIKHTCPDGDPDLILMRHYFPKTDRPHLPYEGLGETKVKKAVIQSDYWDLFPITDQFIHFIESNEIDFIFSYYQQPINFWQNTPLAEKMIFVPPCFDPAIFTDWKEPKIHDVGFLAAGTVTPSISFYPERYNYHNRLLQMSDIRYLYAAHPGWGEFSSDAPLVGKGFSRTMNACKIFVTTGGIYKNAQPKVFEALASRTMLLCDEALSFAELGLVDGVNYVKIDPNNLEEQVRYLLANPDFIESITEKGYQLALSQHSCYARAAQLRFQLYYKYLLEGLNI